MDDAQSKHWWWAGQDNSFDPCSRHLPASVPLLGGLNMSALLLSSININYTLLISGVIAAMGTCPWGQRWDNDKIRGLRKGKTRKEEFKQLWSGSFQNILLLLPSAHVSCAWSWQTWSLAAPGCAKENSKSKHPFPPTQGQAASVAAREMLPFVASGILLPDASHLLLT